MIWVRFFIFFSMLMGINMGAGADPNSWKQEWPKTNFAKTSVQWNDILSGGPPKDGIPAIDNPKFLPISEILNLNEKEAVISVEIDGQVRAYPLRIMMWHEIVNDVIAGTPVTITYCPLCNAALVFDRRLGNGQILDFGTTGKLRNSDLIMYDRQTETWWQQFMGEAIVGDLQGTLLKIIPSRLESWALFKERYKTGKVLTPSGNVKRSYGKNPYVGYAQSAGPFLYGGEMPKDIAPMALVLVIGEQAWSMDFLKLKKWIEKDGLLIEWQAGQSSALGTENVFSGRDIGNVTVQKNGQDVAHHLTFAFAYHAFYPKGIIVQE